MKILNSKIIKIAIFTLFMLIVSATFSNSNAYQLNTVGVPKEYLNDYGDANFPDILYRKQVSAHSTTATKYRNGTYPKNAAGWVDARYISVSDLPQDGEVSATYDTYEHRTWFTFQRIYEYFHQYQNSNYRTEPATGYKAMNYSTREFITTDSRDVQTPGKATCYNVYSETENYAGVYNVPLTPYNITQGVRSVADTTKYSVNNPEIVIMDSNLYRFAVSKDNVFVSDNILTQDTLEKLVERFGENISNKTLTVYNSSILRTSVENGQYFEHMDTAYKFLQTTKYGNKGWGNSKSIYGGSNGSSSFINYYDNTLELPIPNNKKVFVRHIDVTGVWDFTNNTLKNLIINGYQTENGQIIEISGWKEVEDGYIPIYKNDLQRTLPDNPTLYSDYYELEPKHNASFIIPNMRYTNLYLNSETDSVPEKSVKSLKGDYSQYTTKEKEIIDEYKCVGKVVGKGATLELAEQARNESIASLGRADDLEINDYNFVTVNSGDEYDYIVIDFYYVKPQPNTIYVRHIDLSSYGGKITKANVDRCIEQNQLLNGNRTAKYDPFGRYDTISYTTAPIGYSELYYNTRGKDLRIYLDPSVKDGANPKYTCVGTNMTSSEYSLIDAKNKMNERLSGTPSSNGPVSEYITVPAGNNVTIVDFYYVKESSRITPGPIERETIGRLSFYTASPTSSSSFPDVNIKASNNNSIIYDVIPSGESLIPSIDNTYNYMLAGINIEQHKDENLDHYLKYTVTQPFKIYCRDGKTTLEKYEEEYNYSKDTCNDTECEDNVCWCEEDETENIPNTLVCLSSGKTINGGINSEATCLKSYASMRYIAQGKKDWRYEYIYEYHTFSDHTYEYKDSETFKTLNFGDYQANINGFSYDGYTWDDTNNILNLKVEYEIKLPFITTFYKVKHIRTYTISKLELLDGYSNAALPLFDGRTHIVYASDTYKNLFLNATVSDAKLTSKLSRGSIKLPTLNVYYNNIDNPIQIVTTYQYERSDTGQRSYDTTLDATATKDNMRDLIDEINDTGIKDKLENLKLSELAKLSGFKTKTINDDVSKFSNGEVVINTDQEPKQDEEALKVTFTLLNDRIKLSNGNIIVGKDTSSATNVATDQDKAMGITKRTETEYKSVVEVDLSEYNENTINISTLYPSSIRGSDKKAIGSQYLPTSSLTKKGSFKDTDEDGNTLKIPESSLNGKRYPYAKVYYTIEQKNLNWDESSTYWQKTNNTTSSNINYTSYRSYYEKAGYYNGGERVDFNTVSFDDTEMKNTDGKVGSETTRINSNTLGDIIWEYGANNTFDNVKNNKTSRSKDADVVDVFTPISFKASVLEASRTQTEGFVNHTEEESNENQIQKNARFTIEITADGYSASSTGYSISSTSKYLKEYYIKFDFDVQDIIIIDARTGDNGRKYNVGAVSAGTWIGPIHNLDTSGNPEDSVRISAFALSDANQASGVVDQETNTYTVRATAYNIPNRLITDLNMGAIRGSTFVNSSTYNKFIGESSFNQSHQQYYTRDDILGHSQYVAEKEYETTNISRVYDFKVTDLKDIDWKNIFRTSTSATTNVHTSKAYYSGIYKWNIYTTKVSEMITRNVSEIGVTQQQTLPLGPYKNTSSTYTKAPKLGYKFSFDLKTTGANEDKKVIIKPRFYYIGKDGTGYTENIKLFYKNSSNRYVSIDNYKLYMVPDDGYRLTFEGTDTEYRFSGSELQKSTVTLGTVKEIKLTNKMMQKADNSFVQIWYGEYKLPNSTIAVKVEKDESGKEKYNINNKLTNGYIGVVFDIKVEEYDDGTLKRTISYSQNDRNYISGENNENTSQWDYEGYLGLKDVGREIANPSATTAENAGKQRISIQLEKGEWQLDNTTYNKIKGTVILYDTDAKASSDYE